MMPKILSGRPEDLDALVDTLSDSFSTDPIMTWVIPAPELYPIFFKHIISEVYLTRGITQIDSEQRGASLWLPPGEHSDIPVGLSLLFMMLKLVVRHGFTPVRRIQQQADTFAKYHPITPHYYLQFIGCRQRDQGKGVGAALLKEGTRLCDETGMPAYLESSNSRNVPLYQRHGFEVTHEVALPNGPTAWMMWREPRDI